MTPAVIDDLCTLVEKMFRKGLALFVAFSAVFSGLIWYKVYLPISSKLEGDQKLIPFLFNLNNILSQIFSDKLGLVPKYQWFRWFFDTLGTSNVFSKAREAKGITVEDSVIAGVPVKIFKPEKVEGENQGHTGVVFLHGGGLVFGSANWNCYIEQCSMIAQGAML